MVDGVGVVEFAGVITVEVPGVVLMTVSPRGVFSRPLTSIPAPIIRVMTTMIPIGSISR